MEDKKVTLTPNERDILLNNLHESKDSLEYQLEMTHDFPCSVSYKEHLISAIRTVDQLINKIK